MAKIPPFIQLDENQRPDTLKESPGARKMIHGKTEIVQNRQKRTASMAGACALMNGILIGTPAQPGQNVIRGTQEIIMKNLNLILLLCLLALLTGCAGMFKCRPVSHRIYGPYLFISQTNRADAFWGNECIPITSREVLLFPVTYEKLNKETWILVLGHPVIYEQMTDVKTVQFRGISGSVTNIPRFIVWARDYYPQGVAIRTKSQALYKGKYYPYDALIPLLPSTDRKEMMDVLFAELRKGEITVESPLTIEEGIDYERVIKAPMIYSWIPEDSNSNDRLPILLWGNDPGRKVRILLDDEDYALMRRYLLDEKDK